MNRPVEFEVAYDFPEYRRFVFAHLREVKHVAPGFLARGLISAVAAVAFFMKKRKMPVCAFRIDEVGIRRRTRGGELVVPWSAVTAVYRYEPGFIVEKGSQGAMPLPYRCLDRSQRAQLEALFARHVAR